VRDAWIGWDFRHHYDRLHLIANNSRFLILPEHHYPNLASRVLALYERRLAADWPERCGHSRGLRPLGAGQDRSERGKSRQDRGRAGCAIRVAGHW
jgi:hypothetical protein